MAKRLAKCDVEFCVRDGIADALRQFVADGNALVAGEFDEAVGEIGIARRQRRLDVLGDQRLVAPQGRIEAGDRTSAAGSSCAARMAPASRACGHSAAHTATLSAITLPEPNRAATASSEKPNVFAFLKMVCRF